MEILSFLFPIKKKSYLVSLPGGWGHILITLHFLCKHGPTWPHTPTKLFAAWLFSEQIRNCCPCGSLKINFVMVLNKEIKRHCCIKLFFNKGKLQKENRQHQQIICGQVLSYIYIHILYIYIYKSSSSCRCHLTERM